MDDPLVSTQWLADRLEDPGLRVFDVTVQLPSARGHAPGSGCGDYAKAHIPGAGFIDLMTELSDTTSPLRFTRPDAEHIEAAFGRAGIGNEHHVVAYSGSSPMWATRLWWLLCSAGHERTSVLDGGLAKWLAEGRPVSSAPCSYPQTSYRARLRESLWATKQEVLAGVDASSVCTINALPRALHTGEAEMGYARPGRIQGSTNVPFHELLDDDSGTLRPRDELREHFERAGAFERDRVISYCGGGIAATLNALALTVAGHPNVAVYDGSLDEWSSDPAMPMETG